MNSKLLIEAIMQQTTVLIAQLSTASGIRAPLAHVADQVFLELAREIERQGVSRKVVADMFGLALRSYQKRVQRLSESATVRNRTLWEAILEFTSEQDGVTRTRIGERFRSDAPEDVAAVLNDLVGSGLLYASGRGRQAFYRAVAPGERGVAESEQTAETLSDLVWITVNRHRARSVAELRTLLNVDEPALHAAVERLLGDGRLTQVAGEHGPELQVSTVLVPVGADHGWEAAVFDHFSAACAAIAAKVRIGPRATQGDSVGGATLSFEVHGEHPCEAEVHALLGRVRAEVNELWNRVVAFNQQHPVAEDKRTRVSFYFGQNVERAEDDGADNQELGL